MCCPDHTLEKCIVHKYYHISSKNVAGNNNIVFNHSVKGAE